MLERRLRIAESNPMACDFPGAGTILHLRSSQDGGRTWEDRYELGSHSPDHFSLPQWAGVIRQHWGIENRTHYPKDATLREDDTRVRNPRILANLIQLRNVVLFFFGSRSDEEAKRMKYLPAWIELNQRSPRPLLRNIMRVSWLK